MILLRKTFFGILLLGALGPSASAQGFQSLSLMVGARELSLANADLAAQTPANLADSFAAAALAPKGIHLSGTFVGQLSFWNGGVVNGLIRDDVGALGASLLYVGAGADESLTGVAVPYGNFAGTLGGALALGHLLKLPFSLSAGAAVSFASETVSDNAVSSLYGQVGLAAQFLDGKFTAAIRASRLGLGFDGVTQLPVNLATGVTFAAGLPGALSAFGVLVAARYDFDSLLYHTIAVGTEITFRRMIFARVGGIFDLGAAGLTSRSGVTTGIGVRLGMFAVDLSARPVSTFGLDLLATVSASVPLGPPPPERLGPELSDQDLKTLPIPRLIAEAKKALAAGRQAYAKRVVIAGMTRAPDNDQLLALLDQVSAKP